MSRLPPRTFTLHRALLSTVAIAIVAGIVPAGIALHRRLASAIEERARADLAMVPRILEARDGASADALMMHAKEFSNVDGLADALVREDRAAVMSVVDAHRSLLGSLAVVVGPDGSSLTGPAIDREMVAATQAGQMPVEVKRDGTTMHRIALAPVKQNGRWIGAAGVAEPIDAGAAGIISGLTRSDVIIVGVTDGAVTASTLDSIHTRAIVQAARALSNGDRAFDVVSDGGRRLAILAPLGAAGTVIFSRALDDELAVLPDLRRVALLSAAAALVLALVLGALLAARVARPVRQLSDAAVALAAGDFAAPLPTSRIGEVAQVSHTFDEMRRALAARLTELRGANEALTDRNARLTALQADLMQRDRLTATGRLVAQLAHEIRNPVANLRNCLELIRRRVQHDEQAREFTELAIDELLRMHELAEQMLDLNRPRDPATRSCSPARVVLEVATLSRLGWPAESIAVTSSIPDSTQVNMAPDALKQVLLNLVQNAREAVLNGQHEPLEPVNVVEIQLHVEGAHVAIDVRDRGPGIAEHDLTRIFDPFFTTKEAVHGVGLGLFVAEGLVRTVGGRLTAGNRDGGGAWFRIDVPIADTIAAPTGTTRETTIGIAADAAALDVSAQGSVA